MFPSLDDTARVCASSRCNKWRAIPFPRSRNSSSFPCASKEVLGSGVDRKISHCIETLSRRVPNNKASVTRQPLLSPKPVSGFLDQQGNQRRYGSLGAMADVSGTVQVLFGDEPVNEEVEEMQPLDVSGIRTPPSDVDRVTLDE